MTKKTSTKTSSKPKIDFGDFSVTGNKENPKVLFVIDPLHEAKGKTGSERGALTNPQKQFIGRYLKEGFLDFDELAFMTAAPPAASDKFDRDKAIADHLKEHREQFLDICKRLQPDMIVAMGKLGARQVYGKSVKITKIRGLADKEEAWGGIPVLPSLGIMHVMRYPENVELFRADMETLKRIVKDDFKIEYREKVKTEYQWITDLEFMLKNPPELLALDCETLGVDMHDRNTKILTVHLCAKEGISYGMDIRNLNSPRSIRLVRQLKQLVENPNVKVVGQNLKFDFGMLREKLGITIANYEWDTMVMAHLVDENMLTFNLADLTRRYVPDMSGYSDEFDKDPIHQGKTRMDLVPADKMLMYGCGDTDATLRLFNVLHREIENDEYLPRYYERIVRPGLRAFCDIERYGFTINKSVLQEFELYLRNKQREDHAKIMGMIPKEIIEEYKTFENVRDANDKVVKREQPFNITRQAFLVAMCFNHKKGLKLKARVFTPSTANDPDPKKRVPSTSTKEHFPYFEGVPFIDAITEYVKNEKLLSTYVGTEMADGTKTGFYRYIKDGKIRPTYVFTGTDTGRLSSRDPNGQNFPKRGEGAKRYRKMFEAPKGWVLLTCDLSQIELRAAAFLANETSMLKFFKDGIDLHAATAAKVMGKSLKAFLRQDAEVIALGRFRAKAVNFGFLYGMWWRKFMSYAKTQYGIDYTEAEAEGIRKAFFELYPGLVDWHRRTNDQIMRDGYIRSPFGRMRRLPSVYSIDEAVSKAAMRKGVNAPVQSFASDLGVMAIGRLHQAGIPEDKFRVIGFVHDDIICMAREDYVGVAARTLRKYMENNPIKEWFGIDLPVKIIAEAAIGYNLSELVEVNAHIMDKGIKTLKDLKDALRAKANALPEDDRKRKGLEKDIEALDRKILQPSSVKIVTKKRRIKLKSKKAATEHTIHVQGKIKETSKPKIKIKKASSGGEAARSSASRLRLQKRGAGSGERSKPGNDKVQKRTAKILKRKRPQRS